MTHYDYGFRIYNPAVGRFLSVDPLMKEYPWNSTYAFAENDVIRCIDLEGLEKAVVITIGYDVEFRGAVLNNLNAEDVVVFHLKADSPTLAKDLMEKLAIVSSLDPEGIGFLAIYSHGSPDSGIWGKEIIDGSEESFWYSQIAFGDDGDFKLLTNAVNNGAVNFADKSIIYLGGCNQCLGVKDELYSPSQAERWKKAVNISGDKNVSIIGANESVGPKDDSKSIFEVSDYKAGDFFKISPLGIVNLGNTVNVNNLLTETMADVRGGISDRNRKDYIKNRNSRNRVISPLPTLKPKVAPE